MMTVVTCLSPYTVDQVKTLVGTAEIEVRLVPDPPAPTAVRQAVVGADVIIGDVRAKHRLDRDTLAAVGSCRLIQQPAVGYDSIDVTAAAEFGIPVANAGGYNAETVADWVVMAALNLLRNGARRDASMHAGAYDRSFERSHELSAMTVGIIGLGNIGRAVAHRLAGFGSTVLGHDPVVAQPVPGVRQVSLDDLLAGSTIITIHAPLTEGTRHLINPATIDLLRPDAMIINASRGPLIDEVALIDALRTGRIGGAALDVYEIEPLDAGSPLWGLANVILTPHVAGSGPENEAAATEEILANLRRFVAGEPLQDRVDPRDLPTRSELVQG
jgi:phosphoglycerate dehydrogenase-like enzyme